MSLRATPLNHASLGAQTFQTRASTGFNATPVCVPKATTASGVSAATTRTVVISSLSVLILDFVMTVLMFRGLN